MPENLQFQKSRLKIGQPSTPRKSIQAAGEVGTAIQAAGHKIKALVEKQQREHDIASVLDATAKMRQSARGRLSGALEKEGADAAGVMKEYHDWYDKASGEIAKDLENNDQRMAFQHESTTRREHDLDTLARHQAVEHKKHLKASLTATIATAEQDVVIDPFNEARISESLKRIQEAFTLAYPGINTKELYDKAAVGIRFSALQEMVKTDPVRARKLLEKWKDRLGPVYTQAQSVVEKEALGFEAKMLFPDDFDAQEDYVAEKDDLSADVKRTVIGRIRSDEAEQLHRREEAKKERREQGYNEFWGAMANKNYGQARKITEGWSGDDFTMRERYLAEQLTENVVMKTNPFSERGLYMDIKKGAIKTTDDLYADPRISELTTEDVRQLESDLKKENSSPVKQERAFTLLEQRFDRLFKDTDYYALKPTFDRYLIAEVQAEEAAKKRPLTGSEVLELGEKMLDYEMEMNPWTLGITSRAGKTEFEKRADSDKTGKTDKKEPGEARAVDEGIISKALPHIPPDIVKQIEHDLANAERAVNAETVNQMWKNNQEHYNAKQP